MLSLKVDWCSFEAAKHAVLNWHYSKRMPAGKLARFGVWEDGKFIGAVVFGMGANNHIACPYGLKNHEVCELVRVALTDHSNTVTKIVALALRMLKLQYPGLKMVVSYADPSEGHHGGIYQAGNWIYLGTSKPDKVPVLDGRIAHGRTLSERVKRGTAKRSEVEWVSKPGKHRYIYPLEPKLRKEWETKAIDRPKRSAGEIEGDANGESQGDST